VFWKLPTLIEGNGASISPLMGLSQGSGVRSYSSESGTFNNQCLVWPQTDYI